MIQNIGQLYGRKLRAVDGDIGCVKDCYFDDQSWAVRYLVADTGSWLFSLHSTTAVTGYQIQAIDGAAGTVSSFMIDGLSWAIREIAISAGHWYAGKKVLLLPENIDRISYEDSTVFVNLSREDIRQTARNDIVQVETSYR